MDATTFVVEVFCLVEDWLHDRRLRRRGVLSSPICRFGRAYRCRRLREVAAFGRDQTAKQTFLGLRAHLRICWPGVSVDGRLTPTNTADQAVAPDLLRGAQGWALADSAYGGSALVAQLHAHGLDLPAPPHDKPRTAAPLPHALTRRRRRVETVIGQLDRYHLERVWARDAWHLWSRRQRKLLSHTIAVLLLAT